MHTNKHNPTKDKGPIRRVRHQQKSIKGTNKTRFRAKANRLEDDDEIPNNPNSVK